MMSQRTHATSEIPQGADSLTWFCDVCFEHGLSNARTSHIARYHKGVSLDKFHWIGCGQSLEPVPADSLTSIGWTCHWCGLCLPKMDKRSGEASLLKHLRRCEQEPPNATAGLSRGAEGCNIARRLHFRIIAKDLCAQLNNFGHDIRHLTRRDDSRSRAFFTCRRCMFLARNVAALQKFTSACKGSQPSVSARVLRAVGKQRLFAAVGVKGRRLLRSVWRLSSEEHNMFWKKAKHFCSKQGPSKQWLHDSMTPPRTATWSQTLGRAFHICALPPNLSRYTSAS